jgi:DNA-binding Lrp family transcriptional regulator
MAEDPDWRGLDEGDVALVDAIHVNPRASFDQLGEALGISAVTAARRWRRLVSSGQAWVSSVPGWRAQVAGALFEAECVPGEAMRTAAFLAEIPQVFSVHMTSGTRQLYALVISDSAGSLARLLLERLGCAPGLRAVRTSVSPSVFSRRNWRLGAISSEQEAVVRTSGLVPAGSGRAMVWDEFSRALFLALQQDGRLSYRDLSVRLGRSEQAVRRRLAALVHGRQLDFRADFVRPGGGWPAAIALWLRVPPEVVRTIGRQLVRWPQVRFVAELVGDANLFVTVQLHELEELDGVVTRLRETFPAVEVPEQQVILRSIKAWGRLLDERGRAVRTVPVDPWAGT